MWFRKIVEALRSRAGNPRRAPSWIAFTDEGFELRADTEFVSGLKWRDVRKIVAFKRDMVTADLVCLAFQCTGQEGVFEVNDEVGGFWDLVNRVKEVFPDSDQEWEESVVQPAFARNAIAIYEIIALP